MTEDTSTSTGTEATTGDGTTTDTTATGSTDGTAEQVAKNDPEKNKTLAEIEMSESLRDMYDLEFELPHTFKGLHTNRFIFMELNDQFYEKNYAKIIEAIKDKKFARYAGFEKGRFFVERHEYGGGIDGSYTKLKVNPLANSYGTYMKQQQQAEKTLIQAMSQGKGGSTGGGLTTMSGEDCSDTFSISTRGYNINETANHKIGNSSANYATDTSSMDGKSAVLDVYNRFHYSRYNNNRTCPQKMWTKSGSISGNCADISRLCMCVGQVHGMTIGIHHMSGHYYNLVQVDGKTYRFDCCCKSSGTYHGEVTNNLTKHGGPWS